MWSAGQNQPRRQRTPSTLTSSERYTMQLVACYLPNGLLDLETESYRYCGIGFRTVCISSMLSAIDITLRVHTPLNAIGLGASEQTAVTFVNARDIPDKTQEEVVATYLKQKQGSKDMHSMVCDHQNVFRKGHDVLQCILKGSMTELSVAHKATMAWADDLGGLRAAVEKLLGLASFASPLQVACYILSALVLADDEHNPLGAVVSQICGRVAGAIEACTDEGIRNKLQQEKDVLLVMDQYALEPDSEDPVKHDTVCAFCIVMVSLAPFGAGSQVLEDVPRMAKLLVNPNFMAHVGAFMAAVLCAGKGQTFKETVAGARSRCFNPQLYRQLLPVVRGITAVCIAQGAIQRDHVAELVQDMLGKAEGARAVNHRKGTCAAAERDARLFLAAHPACEEPGNLADVFAVPTELAEHAVARASKSQAGEKRRRRRAGTSAPVMGEGPE